MIELAVTAESVGQAVELLATGADALHTGEETFGLRLPVSFIRDEQHEIVKRAHEMGEQVLVAVNGIMHSEKMKLVPEYLTFLKEINVDKATLDDLGTVFVMQRDGLEIPYVYNDETPVTSSRQINFWNKRGVIEAVLAREVPSEEMVAMEENLAVPAEILVYGMIYIHQSKCPLIQNYYNYAKSDRGITKDEGLFISEPKKPEIHYSIHEDNRGAHILTNNDADSMNELTSLYDHHYHIWKPNGLYTPDESFIAITRLFTEVRATLEAGTWSGDQAAHATVEIERLHPTGHGLDNGFFDLSADAIK